jgi:multiple sugar transport system permease protein
VFTGPDTSLKGITDADFWAGVERVVLFGVVQIPVMLALSLVMALLLDGVTARGIRFFRVGFLIPYTVPGVVGALIWLYLYSPTVSPISDLLGSVDFFSGVNAYLSIGNVLTWQGIGINMILIYAALQAIPGELYEAARMDGAPEWRIAWSIKVPNIRGILVLTGMFSIIGRFQLFGEPLVLRKVGPQGISTDFTPMMMIYEKAIGQNNYTYGSALSIILAAVTGVLAFVFYRITNRKMT